MAASAADVRSALNLPESGSIPGPSSQQPPPPTKKTNPSTRKPDGIPRELYQLIGPAAPTLAAQFAKPRLKQKPNLGGGSSKTKWELKSFKHPSRSDGLVLKHWEKVLPEGSNSSLPKEHLFAKYNVQPPVYDFTPEEYTKWLDDREWTREETKYLLDLVHSYDIRWYIIHDRYDWPGGPLRLLDDLKERYYSVCRKLIRNQPWHGDEALRVQLLSSYQFDKERELTRKKYIESLENRDEDALAEEEALYVEIKRLEQNERKFKRDRENLLRTLLGVESGLPDITEDDISTLGTTSDNKKKKKGGVGVMESETPTTPAPPQTPAVKRPHSTRDTARDAANCILRWDVPSSGIATKAAHPPAYLRSFKIPYPKATIAPKISQALAEIGISNSRLVMPTRETVMGLEALIEATTHLVETKKVVDKLDADIAVMKERISARQKALRGENGTGGEGEDAVGEPDTENEDGRAMSVMSASGRNKKHARRSMSISSVDTIARPNNKRQKRG